MHVLHRCVLTIFIVFATVSTVALAESCRPERTLINCAPAAAFQTTKPVDARALVFDDGTEFSTALTAQSRIRGEPRRETSESAPPENLSRVTDDTLGRLFCRRDDHPFLPSGATAGISCESKSTGSMPDPRQVARSMFDRLDLPSLRLGMNPRLGMVNLSTWFWVEGYDGMLIPLTDNLVLTHDECQQVVERDADGNVALDSDGAPVTHRECRTISDTLTVDVRAWPRAFDWSFGDNHGKLVPCPDQAGCPGGVGRPYTDPYTASPIAHAYHWSSLGINGDADAYTVGLTITFGAEYRFSINGASASGWASLRDRELTWTASHRVQEAQAVLTRP